MDQKKILMALILLVAILNLRMSIVDGGDCVLVFAEFHLSENKMIKGFTPSGRIDFENAEKDFKHFLHYSYENIFIKDTVKVYHKIDTIKLNERSDFNNRGTYFFACPIDQVSKIGYDDWTNGKMLRKYSCHANGSRRYPYSSPGFTPIIITELNEFEIEKMKGSSELSFFIFYKNELTSTYLVSLNNRYTGEDLKKLYLQFSKIKSYQEQKMEFRKLGIAMFMIYEIA